jgi:hypothetical protein
MVGAAAAGVGLPAGAVERGADVVDRVAAVVDGQVITLSQLEFETRIHLIQRGGVTAASGPLDEDTLRAALELVIAERVEASEADRLQAFSVEPDQLSAAMAAFERFFPSPAAFQAFLTKEEADRSQVASVITRSIRADRLLDSRIQLRAQVPDWEVRQYYDTHPELRATPFEQLRAPLKEKLVRQRYAVLAKQELSQMMRSAQVRRVVPFAQPEVQP